MQWWGPPVLPLRLSELARSVLGQRPTQGGNARVHKVTSVFPHVRWSPAFKDSVERGEALRTPSHKRIRGVRLPHHPSPCHTPSDSLTAQSCKTPEYKALGKCEIQAENAFSSVPCRSRACLNPPSCHVLGSLSGQMHPEEYLRALRPFAASDDLRLSSVPLSLDPAAAAAAAAHAAATAAYFHPAYLHHPLSLPR